MRWVCPILLNPGQSLETELGTYGNGLIDFKTDIYQPMRIIWIVNLVRTENMQNSLGKNHQNIKVHRYKDNI